MEETFYCIVCKNFINILSVTSIIASLDDGGWHCGYHTKKELKKAKKELQGQIMDMDGNLYHPVTV